MRAVRLANPKSITISDAPKTAGSADGSRRIVFAWATERWCDDGAEYSTSCSAHAPHTLPPVGWDGSQTLPRELSVDPDDGQLRIKPVREAASLRVAAGATPAASVRLIAGAAPQTITRGRALEVRLNASMPGAGCAVAMDVLASSSTSERTTILLTGTTRKLEVLTADSSLGPVGARSPYSTPPLTHDSVELTVIIDHSIIELFVNDVFALTARAYPTTADSDGVRLRSSGGDATVSVATWQLAP